MSIFKSQPSPEQSMLQQYQALLDKQKSEPLPMATSTEPIVGLRVWHVVNDKGLPKLRSVVKSVVWPYRKALERDPIMAEGIHAIRRGERIMMLFQEYQAHVAGEVYLWGKVTEHELGYLADCAYPKRLFVPEDFCPIKAMQLEDEYGVPCEYRAEFVKQCIPDGIVPGGIVHYSPYAQSLYPSGFGQAAASNQTAAAYHQMLAQQQAIQNQMLYGNVFYKNPFDPQP